MECSHDWQPDQSSGLFEDCRRCGASRRVREYCSACGGKRWTDGTYIDDGGYKHTYRAPCGACDASGLVAVNPPKLL